MDVIDELFNRMDTWRHLPDWQLERRADLFFSLYLKKILEHKYGLKLRPELIPEFPVHIATIQPHSKTNMSFKIDYVAVAEDYSQALLVELKTDVASRSDPQDRYLTKAVNAGLPALIGGLTEIYGSTREKKKYLHLFALLEKMELVSLPIALRSKMKAGATRGTTRLVRQIELANIVRDCHIIYLQPTVTKREQPSTISFDQAARVVAAQDDVVSRPFACALRSWSRVPAGTRKPNLSRHHGHTARPKQQLSS